MNLRPLVSGGPFPTRFFAWLGMLAFAQTSEGSQQFDGVEQALANMWMMFVGSTNFPDADCPIRGSDKTGFCTQSIDLIEFPMEIGPTTFEIDRSRQCGHFGLCICLEK